MQQIETLDDRQRVDRWLEESQYLLGRLIPGFLDDRDRLKEKLAGVEAECERLRAEAADLRQELGRLRGELDVRRGDQQAAAEACAGIMAQLGELQRPLHDLCRHLQKEPTMHEATA